MTIRLTKTRLALAVLAVTLLIPATALATHIFNDVPDGAFYADSVEWAADNGITQGRTPTMFDPDAGVTRGESVTFLGRYDTNVVQPALDAKPDQADLDGKISHGEIVLRHSPDAMVSNSGLPSTVDPFSDTTRLIDGAAQLAVDGPAALGGVDYGLKSIEFCIDNVGAAESVQADIYDDEGNVVATDASRTADGCYSLAVNHSSSQIYRFLANLTGTISFDSLQSTWAPTSALGPASVDPDTGSDDATNEP